MRQVDFEKRIPERAGLPPPASGDRGADFKPKANHDSLEPPGLLMVPVVPQLRPDPALRELFDLPHLSSPRASLNLSLLRLFRARARTLSELR